jgi:ribosomal protein S18 acetylase RimI-like enzyme
MLVRTATAADAASIAQIHVETWRVAYRGQIPDAVLNGLDVGRRTVFWQERLSQGRGAVFVAEDGDRITGFCDLVPSRDKDADARTVAEIVAIYILPQHWRKGTGRALCNRALATARQQDYQAVTLWVLASISGARRFYEAMGFSLDGAAKADRAADGSELHEVRFRRNLA